MTAFSQRIRAADEEPVIRKRILKKGDTVGWWIVLGDAPDRHYTRKTGRLKGRVETCRFLYVECRCGHRREISMECLKRSGEPSGSTKCIDCANKLKGPSLRKLDLKKRYGSWRVLFRIKIEKKKTLCLCECDCGYRSYLDTYLLRVGRTKGCKKCQRFKVAKHSLETVNKIKALLADNVRMCDASKALNVPYHIVKSIKYGKAWK